MDCARPWKVGFTLALVWLGCACNSPHDPSGDERPASQAPAPPPTANPAPTSAETAPSRVNALPKRSGIVRPEGAPPLREDLRTLPVPEQQKYLIDLLSAYESLSEEAKAKLTALVTASEWMSFGNPKIAQPVMTQGECLAKWELSSPAPADPSCGHPHMVRVPGAKICIDQYEFPNVPCEYPLVWTRSSEAAELCSALGKRLCDAHEWEGACAGQLHNPEDEYHYARLPKGEGKEYRRARRMLMESWHNLERPLTWAYGPEKNHALCGTAARKSPTCTTVDFGICGTNDYPAGSFPECRTERGVYDQHGNVAEHMSLPLYPEELGGRGYTEMKGSWFLFGREETHPDDCRWRARNWHTTKITDPNSHRNYHLGFRCCDEIPGE